MSECIPPPCRAESPCSRAVSVSQSAAGLPGLRAVPVPGRGFPAESAQRGKASAAGASRIRQVPFPKASRRRLGLRQPTPGQRKAPSSRLFLLLCLLPLKLTSWRLVPLNGREGTLSSRLPLRKVPALLALPLQGVCSVVQLRAGHPGALHTHPAPQHAWVLCVPLGCCRCWAGGAGGAALPPGPNLSLPGDTAQSGRAPC